MGRPKYETDRDRAAEKSVLEILARKWGVEYVIAPDFSPYDATLTKRGVLMAAVEIKCRAHYFATYDSLLISKRKVDRLIEICQPRYRPLLVVSLLDRIVGIELDGNYPTELGGRTDRGDDKDLEICYKIPIQRFNKIEDKA